MIRWADKAPAETREYVIDWYDLGLLPCGDTITGSTWNAGGGVTLSDPGMDRTYTRVTVAGGVRGGEYRISNTITTAHGAELVRTGMLAVKEL